MPFERVRVLDLLAVVSATVLPLAMLALPGDYGVATMPAAARSSGRNGRTSTTSAGNTVYLLSRTSF